MDEVLKDINDLLDSKLPIKDIGTLIETLNGYTSDSEFCKKLILKHSSIITKILQIGTSNDGLAKPAFEFLINIFSQPGLTVKFLESAPSENLDFSEFLGLILHSTNHSTKISVRSLAARLLSNITREKYDFFEKWKISHYEEVICLLEVGLLFNCDEAEVLKDDVIMIILNLSQEAPCQKFIMKNLDFFNDMMINFDSSPSERWMVASVGLLKNLLINSEFHLDLLEKIDLLTILLHRLVGLNDYKENVWNKFPENLKRYVGSKIECSPALRCLIMEALYLLSATKYGRIRMRDSNVYDILKNISELELSDEESDKCLDCIGLLIRTEDEIGYDDLLTLEIPKDVEEKFKC